MGVVATTTISLTAAFVAPPFSGTPFGLDPLDQAARLERVEALRSD